MSESPFKDLLARLEHVPIRTDRESVDIYRVGTFGNTSVEFVELAPGQPYPQHIHDASSAYLYFLFGKGGVLLGNNKKGYCGDEWVNAVHDYVTGESLISYKPGKKLFIPAGMPHGFEVDTPTLFLSLNTPPIISADGSLDFRYAE
jgi:quercetin dioxygenase-like cupin family protein